MEKGWDRWEGFCKISWYVSKEMKKNQFLSTRLLCNAWKQCFFSIFLLECLHVLSSWAVLECQVQKNKECNKASDLTLVGVLVSRMLVGCLVVPYLLPLASGGSDANQMDKETLTRRGTEVWHHLRALLLKPYSLPSPPQQCMGGNRTAVSCTSINSIQNL